ncbi:uncharacterized protein LOC102911135 isoform X2 [Peromyscus maniculatus bairdii]|uniref:uncharacterized protein LOC102911135 isoform X2 n=1 Tax=Peromyscus maniculatus bairdii TaxID=230844 RepID=UPI001C2E1ECC|nr:uncharacterized protein LOC102911135 isoform X2 [Peromyscus maniculatus bairdii]
MLSPESTDNTTTTVYKRKRPIRMVKGMSRKRRYGSKILGKLNWEVNVVPKDAEGSEAQAETCRKTPQSEMEASHQPSDSTDSPMDQRKPPVRMLEVVYNKRKCVSALLKKRCIKTTVIPLDMDGPQVISSTSRETSHIKTEVVHKNADIASSSRQQRAPPVMMVEVESRKRIPAFLREICRKQSFAPRDVEGPPVPEGPSAETTPMQVEALPEKTPVKVEKVKNRKFNCIFSIFRRFYKKKTVTSQDVDEPPAAPAASAASAVTSTSKEMPQTQMEGSTNVPDIKQIFCREEEFDHHDEGAWEEYQSYFPGGIHVPESKHTVASNMLGSYVAQVGDTDVEEQQNIDSKESFPDAFEVQLWELRKVSSTVAPVLNVLYLAPTKSSDEDILPIKKKKKRRKRYY